MELLILALLAGIILLNFILLLKKSASGTERFETKLDQYEKRFTGFETILKDEFARNRTELTSMTQTLNKEAREESARSFRDFSLLIEQKLTAMQEQVGKSAKENRDELSQSLKSFEKSFSDNVKSFNELQKQKFDDLSNKFNDMTVKTEQKLEKMRESVENKLKSIQDDNNIKLEKMRETVDEKLHKTLETRLGESFKLVSERLELVQKGLGEMQTLATGVGDLKKVLSNVKTKGVLGEYQLEGLLDQLLTKEQYDKNVKTKSGSRDNVEFAVRIPAKDDMNKIIYLPIDAKFPSEDYLSLMNAYEIGDVTSIDTATKELTKKIKTFAKDIHDKYIDPPNTTDFGIMFLPFEGLYAEVLRINGLFETIQREYKVTITGPTTISALLNSLQMGFRTLAIEKRSSDVWRILGTVKTEFGKFGEVLEATKKKLNQAVTEIDNAGVRTRAIERSLKDVEALPVQDAAGLLSTPED